MDNFESLNTGFPTQIPDNHLSDALNMIKRRDGLWENRKGMVQFGDDVGSGNPIHSLFFWKSSGGDRYLTVGTGTDLYSYSEGSAYNDGSYTNRKSFATSSDQWDAIAYRSIAVISNGTDDVVSSTDNVTFTDRSGVNVAKAKFLDVGNDFVSFGGILNDPDKIVLSSGAPSNPWEFDSNNVANVDIGNVDEMTGTLSLGSFLVVTKKRQTYSVALSDFSRETLDWGGGCESNRAILRTQKNSLFIAGRQGIFDIAKTQIGDNQLFGSPESERIESLYGLVSDYSTINGLYTFDNNYALWNAQTSLGRLTFVRHLDFQDEVWSYFQGINAKDWEIYEDSDSNLHYLFSDAATDKVWELFKGRNDNGAPILSRIATKRLDFGAPGQNKDIEWVDIYGYISKNAVWKYQILKNDDDTIVSTGEITQSNLTQSNALLGLNSEALNSQPLVAFLNSSDDLDVFPFWIRIPLASIGAFEKIQVILENNQADARVILRALKFRVDGLPEDYIPINNYA